MNDPRQHFEPGHGRRGMILLLVLLMLTLFILMGSLATVIATRARDGARAFADATASSNGSPAIAETMADEALFTLIRGSKDPAITAKLGNDSLLKDMYGLDGKGRFADEAYDAFDDANPFLTQVQLDAEGRVTDVPRPAFAGGQEATVDNDGDGVADSVWLDGVLPTLSSPNGNDLKFRVAYLVLDLDGRINVNAHGKRADAPAGQNGEAGPADLDASSLMTPAVWNLLMERTGGQLLTGSVSPGVQWRLPPPISSPVDGRFGGMNSGAESDTYKLRLDHDALRPAALSGATGQNPFTLGELERVLRQFDADAATLPPRLAGILHDRAERSRMWITTDSWETPGDRLDIQWDADNSGRPDETAAWQEICAAIQKVVPGVPQSDLKQWVANLIEFRDIDAANPTFPGGFKGVEPRDLGFPIPGGPVGWDQGYFASFAQVLGIPMGTLQQIKQKKENGEPLVSLAKQYPKILEALMVPTLFKDTYWEFYQQPEDSANPNRERTPGPREPGRVNVNTCDKKVWDVLLGEPRDNPFDGDPAAAAKHMGDLLMHPDLVFGSDPTLDVASVNHAIANRLANAATVRSHVFAVWITVEVTDTSPTAGQPTYHRLFAIVDRSLPMQFNSSLEGTNGTVRDLIRLRRFLN